MKKIMRNTAKIITVIGYCLLVIGFTSCSDKLELSNPNQPTTGSFGNTIEDLEQAVIACYHHCRMEGTYARVGYTLDACRGDEVWNVAQSWGHIYADNLNAAADTCHVINSHIIYMSYYSAIIAYMALALISCYGTAHAFCHVNN